MGIGKGMGTGSGFGMGMEWGLKMGWEWGCDGVGMEMGLGWGGGVQPTGEQHFGGSPLRFGGTAPNWGCSTELPGHRPLGGPRALTLLR